jgi:CspA family cold shock protein
MFQVKWFNKKKGFGFVTDGTGKEYFCHHSDISISGYRFLRAGEYVRGELVSMEDSKQKLSNIRAPTDWGTLMCQVRNDPPATSQSP